MMKKITSTALAAIMAVNLLFPVAQAQAQQNFCSLLQPMPPDAPLPPGVPNLRELLKKTDNPNEIVSSMLDPVAPMPPEKLQEVWDHAFNMVAGKYLEEGKLDFLPALKEKYDGKIKTRAELDTAIAELVKLTNDRWTSYSSPSEKVKHLMNALAKKVPFGLALRQTTAGNFEIEAIMAGSAAKISGLREGDQIISVNGKKLAGMSKADADLLFYGQAGSSLKIESMEDGKLVEKSYTLTVPVAVEAVGNVLENNIAYLKLPSFMSAEDFGKIIKSMTGMAGNTPGGLQGLILDLRNNGGGRVDFAKELIAFLLKKGVVIQETEREGRIFTEKKTSLLPLTVLEKMKFSKEEQALINDLQTLPLVVLINGSSASASEIVTGALKESRPNTTVIGERSFGKFKEMIVAPLPNCGQLAVTSGTYTTPTGQWLQDAGIAPDMIVHQPRDSKEDAQMIAAMNLLKEKTGKNPANVVQMDPEARVVLGPAPVRPGNEPAPDTDWAQLAREHRTLLMQIGFGSALLGLFGIYLFLSRRRED